MLVDYHGHVNFNAFKNDSDEVIKRALAGGVFVVAVGTQIDTSRRAVELAEKYGRGVYAAVGLHPIHLENIEVDEDEIKFSTREEVFDYLKYKEIALNGKVVAIGECGLDYFHSNLKEKQRATFIQHLDLASELKLPVIIHCRGSKENPDDAYRDILNILSNRKLESGGVIHCFMSSLLIAREFLSLGLYIGFTGVITFPKTFNYAEVIRAVPNDRILVETDCPYLSPVPYRGKRNEPLFVKYVAAKVSQIKGIDMENQLFENTLRLFPKIKIDL